MELRNIKTFLCVAEQCSFSKAAVMLGYSQSTVTTQIQQLEQEFGTLLFERIHKTVRLTAPSLSASPRKCSLRPTRPKTP